MEKRSKHTESRGTESKEMESKEKGSEESKASKGTEMVTCPNCGERYPEGTEHECK